MFHFQATEQPAVGGETDSDALRREDEQTSSQDEPTKLSTSQNQPTQSRRHSSQNSATDIEQGHDRHEEKPNLDDTNTDTTKDQDQPTTTTTNGHASPLATKPTQHIPHLPQTRKPTHRRFLAFLTQPISPKSKLTSWLLLLLALATGINDAATFIDYHLFVSNQTGNTVFLGIGALYPDSIFDLRHVGLSLGGFCAGGLFAGQLAAYVTGKRSRWWVTANNILQTVLTLAAAALRQWYALGNSMAPNHGAPQNFSVVVFLAVASGMQVAMARALGVAEIPTGMITSAWIDLMADPDVWVFWRRNSSRDKRLAFVLCILVGGFIGAAAHVYCAPALPLLLAACVKAVVTVGFFLGMGEVDVDKYVDGGGSGATGESVKEK